MSESISRSVGKSVQRSKSVRVKRRQSAVDSTTKTTGNNAVTTTSSSIVTLSPMLKLAASKQFDKIDTMLRKKTIDLDVFLSFGHTNADLQTMHHSMTTADTAPSSSIGMNSSTRFMILPGMKHILQQHEQRQHEQQVDQYPTTPLHKILEHRPPYATVSLLCRALTNQNDEQHSHPDSFDMLPITPATTNPVDTTDDQGRKPLHIACQYGCDYTVIKRLLKGSSYVRPYMSCDIHGRTPLHYACSNPRGNNKPVSFIFGFNSSSKNIENMIQIVECLLNIYPRASILKDQSGKTPLDIAQQHRAVAKIVEILTKAAEQVQYSIKHRQQRLVEEQQQLQHDEEQQIRMAQKISQQHVDSLQDSGMEEHNGDFQRKQQAQAAERAVNPTSKDQSELSPREQNVPTDVALSNTAKLAVNHQYNAISSDRSRGVASRKSWLTGAGARTLVTLNEYPIDLDKEMDNYKMEYWTTNANHNNNHHHLDESMEIPSLVDLVIECNIVTDCHGNVERCDDESSLGSDCISKHARPKFEPFTNVTDLIDI